MEGAAWCTVANQRSPRLSRCPSEVARVGGHGGRRLLTIWIVLLANLQQTGEALTDGRRVRAPWLGARAGIPAGSSPIWVSPSREMEGTDGWDRERETEVERDVDRSCERAEKGSEADWRWSQVVSLITATKQLRFLTLRAIFSPF